MDKLVQEKQASMEAVPITVIPIVSTSTPVSTSTLASTIPKSHPIDEANKLIKEMEDMSIQNTNINKLKEQVNILEDENKFAELMHQAEVQKSNRLT